MAHASEIQYLFNTPAPFPQALNADQQQLSDAMVGYWTRFARTGKPAAHHASRWRRFDVNGGSDILSLEGSSPVLFGASAFRGDHKCLFWDGLLGN